jgi:hypothetical protein
MILSTIHQGIDFKKTYFCFIGLEEKRETNNTSLNMTFLISEISGRVPAAALTF